MMGRRFLFVLLLTALIQFSFAQSALKGIIKDGKGQPVEAASIKVKGTAINAVADGKGQFSIPAPKELPFTFKAFLASSKFKSNSALNEVSISLEIASNSEFSERNP